MNHSITEEQIRRTVKRLEHYCDPAVEGTLQHRCGEVFRRFHPGRDYVQVRDLAYWWLGYMGNAIGQRRLTARDIIEAWNYDMNRPECEGR